VTTISGAPPSDAGAAADGASSTADVDASQIKAQTILTVNGGAAAACASVPAMKIGDFGSPSMGQVPKPVVSGDSDSGKLVTVTCRTAPSGGGGFALQATIAIAGDASISLQGTLDAQGRTVQGSLVLERGSTTWTSATCTTDSSALPQGGVAPGRYWGIFNCSDAKSNAGAACGISVQLRIENCEQN